MRSGDTHNSHMDAICSTCATMFRGVDRNEDGAPEIPDTVKCASEDCEAWLCPVCREHFAFECDACGHWFCNQHMIVTIDRLKLCGPCHLDIPVLDYEDGGELECGVCRKPCYRHYRQHGQIDIGECCVALAPEAA
jgi:hypothetical protein